MGRSLETKLSEVPGPLTSQLVGFQYMGYAFSPFIKLVRGILCVWNCARFLELARVCQPIFIAVKGSWVAGEGPQGLICLYAPNDQSDRLTFFDFFYLFYQFLGVHRFHHLWGF